MAGKAAATQTAFVGCGFGLLCLHGNLLGLCFLESICIANDRTWAEGFLFKGRMRRNWRAGITHALQPSKQSSLHVLWLSAPLWSGLCDWSAHLGLNQLHCKPQISYIQVKSQCYQTIIHIAMLGTQHPLGKAKSGFPTIFSNLGVRNSRKPFEVVSSGYTSSEASQDPRAKSRVWKPMNRLYRNMRSCSSRQKNVKNRKKNVNFRRHIHSSTHMSSLISSKKK